MKPLLLKGHERAITRVRLNQEGDILFTASKDTAVCVYYVDNGERVGTYEGHRGTIWDIDVTWDTRTMVSAGADGSVGVWDVETGTSKQKIPLASGTPGDIGFARAISLSYSGNYAAISAHKPSALIVIDLRVHNAADQDFVGKTMMSHPADAIVYSHLDDQLIVGNHNGELLLYETQSRDEPINFSNSHSKRICDLQVNQEQGLVISASVDKTAQLHNAKNLELLKTYKSGRPVNSAAISPKRDHIVLGGGEEAMGVTQTAGSAGQFEAKLYHMIYEDEFARFKGHFGPINSLCFDPTGYTIITGGEDGYVRVQDLGDTEYTDFDIDIDI